MGAWPLILYFWAFHWNCAFFALIFKKRIRIFSLFSPFSYEYQNSSLSYVCGPMHQLCMHRILIEKKRKCSPMQCAVGRKLLNSENEQNSTMKTSLNFNIINESQVLQQWIRSLWNSIRIFDFFLFRWGYKNFFVLMSLIFFAFISFLREYATVWITQRKEERNEPTTFIGRLRDSYNFSSNWLFWRKNLSSSWNGWKMHFKFFSSVDKLFMS